MSNMRQTISTVTTTNNHESNLDALLDDLQSTISRTSHNPSVNGNVTGYREIRRTVTDPNHGSTTQYHIEYLQPANTTTHISETSTHNGLAGGDLSGQNTRYKEVSYKYQTSGTKEGGSGDGRLRQNISELDSLLDDLHTAQQNSFSESNNTLTTRTGVDPGLLEPVTSTPIRTVQERRYREEKRVRGRSSSPRRELVFTGGRSQDSSPLRQQTIVQEYSQSPLPVRQHQIYRYEKTTTSRTTGPTITDITPPEEVRYNYPQEEQPLALTQGPHSPVGSPTTHSQTSYYTQSTVPQPQSPQYVERVEKVTKYTTGKDYPERRDPSPARYGGGKTSQAYSYKSSTRESRSETRTPPPHRSPSPVSFPQPPLPNTNSKNYPYDGGVRSPSPQKFSPSDPSRILTYNVSPPPPAQQANYKYTTVTTTTTSRYPHEEVPLLPRPFPNPSPSPTPEQQPPKKLDELMASFSDTDMHQYHTQETSRRYESQRRDLGPRETPPPPEKIIQETKVVEKKDESKNLVGPPVYYPPGELFTKKEETLIQRQVAGGKYKEKEMYEYEASSKSKTKETTGKAIVPVCIPLCCGLPCVIM